VTDILRLTGGHHVGNLLMQAFWSVLFNPLMGTGNYSATSNNMKLVHWQLMGGLLHLVQRGGDWAGPQPTRAPCRCTECNCQPINGQWLCRSGEELHLVAVVLRDADNNP